MKFVDPRRAIKVTRSGSQPSRPGPGEYFTGSVRVDSLFDAKRSDAHDEHDAHRDSGMYRRRKRRVDGKGQ
jgi:hypothetical protein